MIFRIRAPRYEFTGLSSLRFQLLPTAGTARPASSFLNPKRTPHQDPDSNHRAQENLHVEATFEPRKFAGSGHASWDAAQGEPGFRDATPALHQPPIAYLRITAKTCTFKDIHCKLQSLRHQQISKQLKINSLIFLENFLLTIVCSWN
jgi:hypothetical protein